MKCPRCPKRNKELDDAESKSIGKVVRVADRPVGTIALATLGFELKGHNSVSACLNEGRMLKNGTKRQRFQCNVCGFKLPGGRPA